MTAMLKKYVVRSDLWIDSAFDTRLAQEPDVQLVVCKRQSPAEAVNETLAQAHVYHIPATKDDLPAHWRADAAFLARCPALLCVSSSGSGYDTVDVAACTQAGVAVVNQAGGNAQSVAEHALGMMLGLAKRIQESDRKLRRTQGLTRESLMGHEISGKVLGIVGLGHTGTAVATLGRAFGMQVLASDPYLSAEEITHRGATSVKLEELLARADVVSLHCPRNQETLKMFDARAFAAMKPGSLFVTNARGGIHDETALLHALQSGHLAGAGLDVWDQEPPPLDHPLLALDNVIATFHTAGVTHEARRNMAAIAAEQIAGLLRGERPPRLINPEVWPLYEKRYAALLGKAKKMA